MLTNPGAVPEEAKPVGYVFRKAPAETSGERDKEGGGSRETDILLEDGVRKDGDGVVEKRRGAAVVEGSGEGDGGGDKGQQDENEEKGGNTNGVKVRPAVLNGV